MVIAVMQLVVERPQVQYRYSLERDALEARMRGGGSEGVPLIVKEDVDRVRREHDVDENATEIDDVLDGVHGQTGPGSGVVVPVVHGVGDLVERRPMQQAMDEVEVQ